jgi:hypothetical protein
MIEKINTLKKIVMPVSIKYSWSTLSAMEEAAGGLNCIMAATPGSESNPD